MKAKAIEFNESGRVLKSRRLRAWLADKSTKPCVEIVLDGLKVSEKYCSAILDLRSLLKSLKEQGFV